MDGNPRTIVVVEHDRESRTIIEEAFSRKNPLRPARVIFVESGEELLECLNRCGRYADNSDPRNPGLILIDLGHQKESGYKALRKLKADPGLWSIPVTVMSPSRQEEDILYSYGLGAASYFLKPVDRDDLLKAIDLLADYWMRNVLLPTRGPGPGNNET